MIYGRQTRSGYEDLVKLLLSEGANHHAFYESILIIHVLTYSSKSVVEL